MCIGFQFNRFVRCARKHFDSCGIFRDFIMVVKSCLNHPVLLADSFPTLGVFKKSFKCRTSVKKLCPARILAVAATAAPPLQIRRGSTTRREVVMDRMAELESNEHEMKMKIKNADNGRHVALAEMWEEIQGSHHWNGLLDPVHPFLLTEIIRYGVFVRACYEAFDLEPGSKYHGRCKYGRKNLLGQLGMENCGYQVTKYIYATADINVPDFLKNKLEAGDGSNWIGYIAVSDDEKEIKRLGRRDIVVALRGTATYGEWLANLTDILTPARLNPLNPRENVKVEMGFLGLYTSRDSACRFNNGSAREQLLAEIARLVQKYKEEELSITITGHSMGSALAMLCAYDIAELELNRPHYESGSRIPITVYSFGGPRVGNAAFKDRCEELGLKILRVVNVHDVVTKIPGVIFNENFRLWENVKGSENFPWNYSHVGVELPLDHKLYSQFFKPKAQHPSCIHDLATYLQLLTCRSIHERHSCSLHPSDTCPDSCIRHMRSFFEKNVVFDGTHLILGLILYSGFLAGSNLHRWIPL